MIRLPSEARAVKVRLPSPLRVAPEPTEMDSEVTERAPPFRLKLPGRLTASVPDWPSRVRADPFDQPLSMEETES